MVESPEQRAALANYVLMYDQIIIPTGNLQILPVLRLLLGEAVFDELIQTRAIVLTRYNRWFAYVGNGGGIQFFSVGESPSIQEKRPRLGLGYFMPLDEAIDSAITLTNPQSNSKRRVELRRMLAENAVELPLGKIAGNLKDETYKDILGSPHLQRLFALRNAGRSMDRLVGIEANQMKICDPHTRPDPNTPEIESVLHVAFENFVLGIGVHTEASEITGDEGTLTVLRAKGERFGAAVRGQRAFAQIQKLSGVPDIGMAFAYGQLRPKDLLDLRYSKHCQAFRDWFGGLSPLGSADEAVSSYVASLGKPSWIESLPAKALRFASTTGLSVLEPVSGTVASTIDSFFLNKWFPGKSPRLFLKQAKVLLEKEPMVRAPMMRGSNRNDPCPCGSGKKYKKCCGR